MEKCLLFDWGDTLMRDNPECDSPMAFWENIEPMPNVVETIPTLYDKYKCIVVSKCKGFKCRTNEKGI